MTTIKLAEALLRRKELQNKLTVLANIKANALFEVKAVRKLVADGIDDVVAQVPKLTAAEVTAEYDWHARQLRLIDAAIQQVNWTADVLIQDTVMQDFKPER